MMMVRLECLEREKQSFARPRARKAYLSYTPLLVRIAYRESCISQTNNLAEVQSAFALRVHSLVCARQAAMALLHLLFV
jgi:hypothetical protein